MPEIVCRAIHKRIDHRTVGEVASVSAAILLAVSFYYSVVWQTPANFASAIDYRCEPFCDFTDYFYPAGTAFTASRSPVQGFFYSPFFASILSVYARFPLEVAKRLWVVSEVTSVILFFLVPAIFFLIKSRFRYYLYLALFTISFPILHDFRFGQISTFLSLCVLGALYCYQKDKIAWSAVLLAISTAIKYYPAIFLLYFIARKEWRFVAIFLGSLFAWMIVAPWAQIGLADSLQYYRLVNQSFSQYRVDVSQDVNSQYIANVFYRLSVSYPNMAYNRSFFVLLGMLIFGANIYVLFRRARMDGIHDAERLFTLLYASFPFIIESSWPHYFVYLPFAFTVVARALWDDKRVKFRIVKGFFLLVAIILSSSIFFNYTNDWIAYSYKGNLFYSNLILLLLLHLSSHGKPIQEMSHG